ncbi:MAG: MFS transporter [Ignavibacteria bacterium]
MKQKLLLISLFCGIHFILGLDINTVSVSVPSIATYFQVTAAKASQIIWVYFIVLTSLLLTFGKMGDLQGFKKPYLAGITIFILGAVFSSLSNNFTLLIYSRIFQAIGTSILFSLTPALISLSFPEQISGKVFGINYAFTALGGILGRTMSGFLIEWFSWRGVFAIVIPFGILSLLMTVVLIKDITRKEDKRKFDFPGAILIFIFLFTFLYGINIIYPSHDKIPKIIIMFSISVIALVSFIFLERRKYLIGTSLINWSLLKNYKLLSPILTFSFIYVITNGMIFISPFFLQYGCKYTVQEAGLLMALPSIFQMISGYLGGRLSDTYNIRKICLLATIILVISLLLYIVITYQPTKILIVLTFIIYGAAIGLFIPANTNRIMSTTQPDSKGSISSLMTTVIRLGSALGTALFAGMFSFVVPVSTDKLGEISQETLMLGFKSIFFLSLLVAFITSIITHYSKDPTKNNPAILESINGVKIAKGKND